MSRARAFFFLSLLFGVVIGLLVSTGIQRALSPEAGGEPDPRPAAGRAVAAAPVYDDDERQTIQLFESAAPSVAFITTQVRRVNIWTRDVFEVPRGNGSGFVWDDQGHVVTNFHVVEEVARRRGSAKVMLGDEEFEASLVGFATDQDLAVLWIDAAPERLVPIRIGTSRDLRVGQKVNAIGNPFGYDHTLTTGIVSALGRTIQALSGATIFDVIQTDAAINPGNSGGPLLDSGGRLIGVNTQIASPSGASAGIGFAVPVDTVSRIVPELILYGKIVRPILGVNFATSDRLNTVLTRRLGVEGALVLEVAPETGAAEAGLRGARQDRRGRISGDVIQKIDGKEVTSVGDLLGRLGSYRPGDTVTLTVWRGEEAQGEARGDTTDFPVRLQAPRQ